MIKKFILLIISLFLFVPASFASDSSIVPVLWLFVQNNATVTPKIDIFFDTNSNTIYEIDGYSYSGNPKKTLKTYYLDDKYTIYEIDGYSYSGNPKKTLKTYYLQQ